MNITGTEKAVKVLRTLVSQFDRVWPGILSIRSIRGSGIAKVTQGRDGVVIHVPPRGEEDFETGEGFIGKWLFAGDYQDTFANDRNVYVGDVFRRLGDQHAVRTGMNAVNSWEYENTATVKAGYQIASEPACGDITGIDPLPIEQWYLIVGVIIEGGDMYLVISQRNDPTFDTTP